VQAGADSVRVGVGSGASCVTRMVTGVGVAQFTAVMDCAEQAKKFKVPVIADGGIKSSREVCLALAAGATCVMAGKLFALTHESAAEKMYRLGNGTSVSCDEYEYIQTTINLGDDTAMEMLKEKYSVRFLSDLMPVTPIAKYRGQASADFQKDFYGAVKEGTVAEGVDFWAPVT